MKSRKLLTAASDGFAARMSSLATLLERIDRHPRVKMRIDPEQRARSEQQRVAVRRRVGDQFAGEVAVRAGAILHHYRLPEPRCQRLSDEAGDDVGRTARRERDEEPDRPCGIRLRQRDGGDRRHCARQDEPDQPGHALTRGDALSRLSKYKPALW
jgi:hypothetical protein